MERASARLPDTMKNDRAGTPDELRTDLTVGVEWKGGWAFDAGKPGRPSIHIDGKSMEGPSPPEALLAALASCTGVDVVEMLTKRKTPPASINISVTAERNGTSPRRVTKAHLAFRITGAGIDHKQTMRAIELSVTRYCTVRDSMDPEMPVTWSLSLG
jgi:putative redox protein